MSRMKDKLIDEMNNQYNGPDDIDWNYNPDRDDLEKADLDITDDPKPKEVDPATGKKMWVIKDYKIWAYSYKQALELLPLIEGF